LENNYDASILDNANDDIKETLKLIVTESKDSGKGNIPLINIIYNYFYGVLPSTRYISGPMSLSYHTSDEYNMKIYIYLEKFMEQQTYAVNIQKSHHILIYQNTYKRCF
jgi:hypothetical protein